MVEDQQLFVSCEHGGNRVPPGYQTLFAGQEERLNSHQGYDPGALPLAKLLAKGMAAPLEKSETTRLLVDLNRSPESSSLFSDLLEGLSKQEKKQLLERYYLPYRSAVSTCINDYVAVGTQVVHLSVHTFTPNLHGSVRNADLGLLYDPERSQEKKFCQQWQSLLKQRLPTLKTRYNYPYRGTADGLVKTLRLRLKQEDYLGIELEVNQALLNGRKNFPDSLQQCLLETLQELFSTD